MIQTSSDGVQAPAAGKVRPRSLYAAYATGPLSNGMTDMFALIVPLWAVSLGTSPTEIGIIVGARNVLPLFLAIHGGVLMDRLGTRRVVLAVALAAACLAPLYPMLPWLPALIALQLLIGLATNLGWVGAQTLIAQLTHGDTASFGRFTFITRLGTFSGPIIAGVVWDLLGPWGAFAFIGLWGACLLLAVRLAPEPQPQAAAGRPPPKLLDLVPRISDYLQSFALLALPPVALAIAISLPRSTTSAIQDSFFVVHLEQIGLAGTAIGTLIAVTEITSGLGSLTSGRIVRHVRPHWILIAGSLIAISLIAITPLLGGVLVLLLLAQALRGASQGVMQPVVLSTISRAVGPMAQGRSLALRATASRLSSAVVPVVMGVVADAVGVEESFYIVGAAVILVLALMALIVARSPAFAARGDAASRPGAAA